MLVKGACISPEPGAKATGSSVEWAECSLTTWTAVEFKFLAWSSIAQSVCQRPFSRLEIRFQIPLVRILHSAEEDNLSPFDSKFAWLCQSIEINNNKHSQTFPKSVEMDIYFHSTLFNGCNYLSILGLELTHWGRYKLAAFSQTTSLKALSWMKKCEFRLKFHWNLFLRVKFTIF